MAVDHLGTGASTRPAGDVDLADQAAAVGAAVAQLPELVGHRGPVVGVGHSMGGYVAVLQQAAERSYAALAVLGTTNQHVAPLGLPPEAIAAAATPEGRAAMLEQTAAALPEPYLEGGRDVTASFFHLDDVPAEVVAADTEATLTVVPRRCAAAGVVPGVVADAAATIDVPVLLAYGELDVSPDPHREPAAYRSCPDLTLLVLAGSGHCHNMATTRTVLWDRLLGWSEAVVSRS